MRAHSFELRPSLAGATGHTPRSGPADPAGIVLQATPLAEFTGRSRPADFGRRGRLPHYDLVRVPSCAPHCQDANVRLATDSPFAYCYPRPIQRFNVLTLQRFNDSTIKRMSTSPL